ncbi:hypothetical protein [Ferruginibacter sp.]|nr:hypothetical protein [Ferruginibacter sp.]
MKQTLSILMMIASFYSCSNSGNNKTVSEAKELASAIKQMQPGGIPTTSGGWTMTAKIAGKEWSASSIVSPEVAGRIFGENNGESISLPYNRRGMIVGNKTMFSQNNAVDLFTKEDDNTALWGGYAGEMEITKVDGDWVEGKFFVTGSSDDPNKKIEVTDGFFRISMQQKK